MQAVAADYLASPTDSEIERAVEAFAAAEHLLATGELRPGWHR